MQASELSPGQEFKIAGMRKFRTVTTVRELTTMDDIPPIGRKVVIIHDGCNQLTIMKETEVLIK